MITRRQLLTRLLGGSVALAAADIWIPGEKTIFLPPRQIWRNRSLLLGSPGLAMPRLMISGDHAVDICDQNGEALISFKGNQMQRRSQVFVNWYGGLVLPDRFYIRSSAKRGGVYAEFSDGTSVVVCT